MLVPERISSGMQVMAHKNPLFNSAKQLLSSPPVKDSSGVEVFPVQTISLGNSPTVLCFTAQPITSPQPTAALTGPGDTATPPLCIEHHLCSYTPDVHKEG